MRTQDKCSLTTKKMAEGQIHGKELSNKRSWSHHRITYVLLDSGAYNNKPSKKYENHSHKHIKLYDLTD